MAPNIDKFLQEIELDFESDYGDFMRKANLYLNELADELHVKLAAMAKLNPPILLRCQIDLLLREMQLHLQYCPNWDIASTRKYLVEKVMDIDGLMRTQHVQDRHKSLQAM